jgi:hypothetical protein
VNIKQFFVTALSQALDLGIATCDDVVRHVTPDVLAHHLPRPLWSRLLTACLGAPRVDAQLVVETVGVPNLCEHIPQTIIWGCLLEIGARALGNAPLAQRRERGIESGALLPLAVAPPPPEMTAAPTPASQPAPAGPSIPAPQLNNLFAELEAEERPTPTPSPSPSGRSRTPTGQRFRQSNTGIGRLAQTNARRPMASATPTPTTPTPAAQIVEAGTEKSRTGGTSLPSIVRRGQTETTEYDVETEIDWKNREPIAVDDEQLVDWSAAEETQTTNSTDDYSRKR